jgi:acyl-CoA reductase-like NAD-dependent aldehyde dehydrogenase
MLCEAMQKDLGRDHFTSWFLELTLVETEIEHTLKHLKDWMDPVKIDTPFLVGPGDSKIVYEPLGVICVMGSWNFPFLTTLTPLVNVIASGNASVIKPSELAPHSLFAMKRLITSTLDTECFICIEGQVKVAITLTQSKFDGICFTGSTDKGKLVAQAAAKNLVPCVLELGGKSPLVVDSECKDLD